MKKLSLMLVLMLLLALPVFSLAESETQETPEATPEVIQNEQVPPYGMQRGRGWMGNGTTAAPNYTDENKDGVCDNCEAGYVDANNDGVCDNCAGAMGGMMRGRMMGGRMQQGRGNQSYGFGRGNQTRGFGRGNQSFPFGHGRMNRNQLGNPNFADENKDGVCDRFADGAPFGMNRNRQSNPNYVDGNNNGVCDSYENNTGRPGMGGMPGRRPN